MSNKQKVKVLSASRSFVKIAYIFIILICSLALLAWYTDKQLLIKLIPEMVPMNPLVAVLFILSGISIFVLSIKKYNSTLVIVIVLIIIGLALTKLSQLFLSYKIPVDLIMFRERLHGKGMANTSAVNFLLSGISMLLISIKKSRLIGIAQSLALFVLLTSLYAGLGYLYNFESLHSVEVYFPMAVHTALCFAFLSVGILNLRAKRGFMRIVTFNGLGGNLARKLLPLAVLFPIVFDWLRFEGQRAGLFPNIESGISLISISVIITLAVIILITAHSLNKIDKIRKRAEKRLIKAKIIAESAKKSQEQFLANMSHEIRTPMNGVVGMTSLLNTTKLNEEQRSYIETIRLSSESLLTIVNDILDFSKIESGKLELETLPFSIKETIDETFNLLKLEAIRKNIKLISDVDPQVPEFVVGDVTRFRQILLNLVSNGIKFTEAGSVSVVVGLTSISDNTCEISISVKDTGIGIEKDKLERLFKAFSQADVSTTRRYGGTGLGLAISANLVKLMDGQLGVHSEPGNGSDFYFSIKTPVATESAIFENRATWVELPETEHLMPKLNPGLNILVAEDNAINMKIINKMLEKLGYRADMATNGREVISAFEHKFYDIVMMDVQMPVMDGVEATGILVEKFRNQSKKPVIIALTANALKGEKEKCLDAGMDDYLSKPFQLSDIRDLIAKWGKTD